MKRLTVVVGLCILLAALALDATNYWPFDDYAHGQARAQGTVPVQNIPQELRSSQVCVEVRGVSPQTATIPAQASNYFYVNFIDLQAYAVGGAVQSGNTGHFTTTNLPGTITLSAIPLTGQASGSVLVNSQYPFSGFGTKALAPGTAVTVVSPTVTNMHVHLNVCGYYGL